MLQLFSTPVKIIEISGKDKTLLHNHIGICSSLNFTKNLWDNASEETANYIKDTFTYHVQNYIKELTNKTVDVYFTQSWINHHKKGHWNSPHSHASNHLVAVYYLQTDQLSGDLLLLDPRGSTNFLTNEDKGNKEGEIYNGRTYWKFTPKTGDLIIFPAYVMHMVTTNTTDEDRRSVALNIKYNFEQL